MIRKLGKRIHQNKLLVWVYFFLVNLPLMVVTFKTPNWSDDYQYTNLILAKAKFSPLWQLVLNPVGGEAQGGHIAPFYIFFNVIVGTISLNPFFFHIVIMLLYITTAYFIYLFVEKYYGDKTLGLLAGTLFLVNYHTAFKAITWNAFHSHATNTLTGTATLYCLLRFFLEDKKKYLSASGMFFVLTIFNLESGLVFYPLALVMALYFFIKRRINFRKTVVVFVFFSVVMALFPLVARLSTGESIPLSHRFQRVRSFQNYALIANELFYKSTGLSALFNNLILNPLKEHQQLKEAIIQFVRENDKTAIGGLNFFYFIYLGLAALFTVFLGMSILILIFRYIRKETRLFLYLFFCLIVIYIFIFYRVDIANAIAVFSSIIMADIILQLFNSGRPMPQKIAKGMLSLYAILTLWTIFDGFGDCYRKSFFGISKVTLEWPDRIYRIINEKVGHLVRHNMIWFTHDYSPYHRSTGFQRVGDMISLGDYLSFNATVFHEELLTQTDLIKMYHNKSFLEFCSHFFNNPDSQRIFVTSKGQALDYLKSMNIDLAQAEAIYISPEYHVDYLNADFLKQRGLNE